ncbi:hypothetical protein NIES2109_60280 (plasmid) [Nostoc sp. HK-01]|nr:hypothetical protein NIES2109_60280 [Nostoc sp. HK-01]
MLQVTISGKLGQPNEQGFVLTEPNIQVFERQPKVTETTNAPGTA